MGEKSESKFLKGNSAVANEEKFPTITVSEIVSEIEWALVEYGFYKLKVFGNIIVLEASNGQKFHISVEGMGKITE